MYDKIMKKISEAMLGVSVISLSIAIVLNAVEIFRRFLYDGSFYWIQDVTLLCMMWFIFPGMIIISYKGNDVFVDIFLHKFPKKMQTSVYKGYKQDKIEMRGDRAEMSDFPLYLNTVAGGLDRRDQTIGGFSFVVKIYAVPVVEIIG